MGPLQLLGRKNNKKKQLSTDSETIKANTLYGSQESFLKEYIHCFIYNV